ncbi:hypothetical protein CROQUDRAFT_517263 [Cronartium quercuum f. sp. fusiforme G11]|uniref:Uncharacterized protein n=1 Tax=Cronartium quercuum f. sp. fusiforme G11 TaxID=708437 RepID=A0A9P6NN05_9BASI|nr:hypothetical protein CROQUDRAFT_517263 [Cronartium quercuum f. sp. fusiforme G11]
MTDRTHLSCWDILLVFGVYLRLTYLLIFRPLLSLLAKLPASPLTSLLYGNFREFVNPSLYCLAVFRSYKHRINSLS